MGSGVPLASGTSHRRHGSSGGVWGLCTDPDISDKSTVHSVSPVLFEKMKDTQPWLFS